MKLLYVLTEAEQSALDAPLPRAAAREGLIVATGPWIKGNGEMPHRVVLRQIELQLIVHTQVVDVEIGYAFFTSGSYFTVQGSMNEAFTLLAAWSCFERRVRRSLNIEGES